MIDLSGLLATIGTTSVTLRRAGATSIDAFGETSNTVADTALAGVVVHPGTSRAQLERLQEADRRRELISVYSESALQVTGATKGDLVQYQGTWYELIDLGDYNALGGMYLATAARLEAQP